MEKLTKEQIEELKEISKLSKAEQEKSLPLFLEKLTPEQREALINQQKQGVECPFCLIISGKIKARKVYEDDKVVAFLDINPVNEGHTLVIPKEHKHFLVDVNDVGYLFNVVNKISKRILEVVKPEGYNVIVNNGNIAGQAVPHAHVHIIPRFKNDGYVINAKRKEISDKEMDKIEKDIKNGFSKVVETKRKRVCKEEPKIP